MKAIRFSLIVAFAVMTITYAKDGNAVSKNQLNKQAQFKSRNESEDAKYAAYSVDGITSASKLAAQRSHTVAGKDERNFAIFTGITVILIVYFFSQFEFFDK